MPQYTSITIIYNPNSTGPGKALAYELKRELAERTPKQIVTVVPTKHAGHAESLAYTHAKRGAHPLIISSSGDGGYHEIINGAMRAQAEGAAPTTGLLPGGNANDHFHSLHEDELAENIVRGKALTIDLLKLEYDSRGVRQQRYAHSYIGLGFTSQAGQELNKHRLNRFVEVWLVAKILLFHLDPVRIQVDGAARTYDSLLFSNIPRMSKILTLSEVADAQDGKFEITAFRRSSRVRLIRRLLLASTRGLKGNRQASRFSFITTRPTLMQLDGEVIKVDSNSSVEVTIEPQALRCVV